ncbi:hypothetical protein COP2_044843 [Malus domestica]
MGSRTNVFTTLVILCVIASFSAESSTVDVTRSDFPADFVFGVTTDAPQYEGATDVARKGPSVWDNYIEKFPERIQDHSNLSIATDSYRRYKEDVVAMKNLGVDANRFSIAWTRILPNGSLNGGINQEGLDHYNNVIDELLKNGIQPFVTLLHFDPPQALTDKYGGVLSRSFVADFKDYCELCFKTYGDRVKNWITINEPLIMAKLGYDLGVGPPARCSVPVKEHAPACTGGNSGTEPYTVSHNLLLAHATVVNLYRDKFLGDQGGQIGISLVGQYDEPFSNSVEDKAAAKRLMDFEIGWYMEPLVYGDYPKIMRLLAKRRIPTFTVEEKKLMKGSFDFIGVNYYTARFGRYLPRKPGAPIAYSSDTFARAVTENKDRVLIGPKAQGIDFIYSYPQGLQKLLEFMNQNYQCPTVYITENGITEAKLDKSLKDPHRIQYILEHLYRIKMAMKNGVNVKGYFHWSLLDNFEFRQGFVPKFGLYYVDRNNNLTRIPKESAKWLPKFLNDNA